MSDESVVKLKRNPAIQAGFDEYYYSGTTPAPGEHGYGSLLEMWRAAWSQGLAHGIAAGLPKWIPVSERLPEAGVSVLVVYRPGGGRFVEIGRLLDEAETWTVPGAGTYHTHLVTHWMPLPALPDNSGQG